MKDYDNRVSTYEIMVNNALNDAQISTEMALYNYTPEKLSEIKTQIDLVKSKMAVLKKEYGEQYQATIDLDKKQEAAHKAYIRLVKFARILFEDNRAAQTALMLDGRRKKDFGGWAMQVQTFYNNLLGNVNYMETMNKLNCSAEIIEQGKSLFSETVKAKELQEIERGEAQIATKERNQVMDALDEDMARLKSVCLLVFEDEPQVLEKLGIVMN